MPTKRGTQKNKMEGRRWPLRQKSDAESWAACSFEGLTGESVGLWWTPIWSAGAPSALSVWRSQAEWRRGAVGAPPWMPIRQEGPCWSGSQRSTHGWMEVGRRHTHRPGLCQLKNCRQTREWVSMKKYICKFSWSRAIGESWSIGWFVLGKGVHIWLSLCLI